MQTADARRAAEINGADAVGTPFPGLTGETLDLTGSSLSSVGGGLFSGNVAGSPPSGLFGLSGTTGAGQSGSAPNTNQSAVGGNLGDTIQQQPQQQQQVGENVRNLGRLNEGVTTGSLHGLPTTGAGGGNSADAQASSSSSGGIVIPVGPEIGESPSVTTGRSATESAGSSRKTSEIPEPLGRTVQTGNEQPGGTQAT